MRQSKVQSRFFLIGLCLLCLAYVAFQFFYTDYAKFCADDFWFEHRIYEFKNALPYRDFAPYKTVLGYYLLLLPVILSHGILAPLLNTKHFIVVINAAVLFAACAWLRRYFPRTPILLTLLLLLFAQFTLVYSTNIRVDLLGYWFCLFSVLLLLENKNKSAGTVLGLGFLVTQKVLWYVIASNAALGLMYLTVNRDKETLKNILVFNVSMIITVGAYILLWSSITNLHTVLRSMFYEAYVMYQLDTYDSVRGIYWQYILVKNPLLFLLAPTTLLSLFVKPRPDDAGSKRNFIMTFATVILLCLLPYKQVFPYYMLVTIPAFLLLYTAFFTWLLAIRQCSQLDILFIGKQGLWALIFLNEMVLLLIVTRLVLPADYLMLGLIPVALGIYVSSYSSGSPAKIYTLPRGACLPSIALLILLFGFIYPILQFRVDAAQDDNRYQRSMLALMDALLSEGGDYVAGIELLLDKNQPINGMRHLDARALEYLYHPTEKNSKAMLASLYNYPPATAQQILQALKKSSVKFYVNNYRIQALPHIIQQYLLSQYQHYWGSIYLYAPEIDAGNQPVEIKFAGNYQVDSHAEIQLDGLAISPRAIIYLTKGRHFSTAAALYRLTLKADATKRFEDVKNKTDMADKMI